MRVISDTEFAKLEAAHGRVAKVDTPIGDVVLRKPKKPEFKAAFAAKIFDLKMEVNYEALDRYVRDTCVFPDFTDLDAGIDEYPALPLLCLNAIVELAGMVGRERAGKSGASSPKP